MSKFTNTLKSLFRRPRPVTKEDAAEIADWVSEGGAIHPDGPPPILDGDSEQLKPQPNQPKQPKKS